MFRLQIPRLAKRGMLAALVLAACLCCGCRTSATRPASSSAEEAQSDRLRRAYPQLHEGRFAIIADFESPAHAEIVQVINASGRAACATDAAAGRSATGLSAMRCRLAGEEDCLLISGEQSSQWTLKRDWRGYDLLLVALHVAQDHPLQLELRAGQGQERRSFIAGVPLKAGWNFVDVDLWQAAQALPLDDVREIRLRAAAPAPVELVLDDVILTRDRCTLLGDRQAPAAALFLESQGRRINAGVSGRFELVFHEGRIVAWYDLSQDPNRLTNLAAGADLGPAPMTWQPPAPGLPLEAVEVAPRTQLEGRQEILEQTPCRIRVRCRILRMVGGEGSTPADGQLEWECTYSLYPSAQMYVDARRPRATAAPASRQAVWAWRFANTQDTRIEPAGSEDSAEDGAAYAVVRSPSNQQASGLVIARLDGLPARLAPPAHGLPAGTVAFAPRGGDDAGAAQFQFFFAGSSAPSIEEIEERVADYLEPLRLAPIQGRLLEDPAGALTVAGFNAGTGAYRMAAEQDVLRVQIDGRKGRRFDPVLEISDPLRRECWVYVDHRLSASAARAADNALVLQLPGVRGGRTIVEVLFQSRDSAAARP